MSNTIRLDIISDVVCPWCLIGLANLDKALAALGDEVQTEIVFHPLQLNPGLPPEGELVTDNIARKYGVTPDQGRARGSGLRAAAEEAGVSLAGRSDRIYDTFDAHRLIHWAGTLGRQQEMKRALLTAYFTHARNVSNHDVLADIAADAGFDHAAAADILARGTYASEVANDEIEWRSEGIASVPTMVIDREFVVSGAQDPARLERALKKLAAR